MACDSIGTRTDSMARAEESPAASAKSTKRKRRYRIMLDKKHLSRLLGRIRDHRGSHQFRQGLVRRMEPRGKSGAEPRHGRVRNYEKMLIGLAMVTVP
jgi:hypothetical protein